MSHRAGLSLMLFALLPGAAMAQQQPVGPTQSNNQIVVEGRRTAVGKSEPQSDWRVAETAHALVYSNGPRDQLMRTAHNLEKLHFLLSLLLNRIDQPDDTVKLKVYLFGDTADFQSLGLRNTRWQQGPFPGAFPAAIYYDPRPDGAVLASTYADQSITLRPGRDLRSIDALNPTDVGGRGNESGGMTGSMTGTAQIGAQSIDATIVPLTAEGRLYAGFAQHYLLTYFPAAYPRWYLDGFGEIFATLVANADGKLDYGRRPEGFRAIIEEYGSYPLKKLLDGSYLADDGKRPHWTPFHAWALTHMLFFDEAWRTPLRNYLTAVARGAPAAEAATALGDPDKLQEALAAYRGRKVPFETVTYPPARAIAPIVRELSKRESLQLRGRLVLASRVELPPLAPPAADAATRTRAERERQQALAARDSWLADLNRSAALYPNDLETQLLLAEAECSSGDVPACASAANKSAAIAPNDARALTWAGTAQLQQAIAGPAAERETRIRAARALIVRANRADPDAVLPMLAYYHSFADAGLTAPEAAINGLIKVTEGTPAAPGPRLLLGEEFARRGAALAALRTLRPIAGGAHDSPEKVKAQQLLVTLPAVESAR